MVTFDALQPLNLSQDDYKGLRASPDIRARVIEKVAAQYRCHKLTREAHTLAEDILRIAAEDAAMQVKRALVETLKDFASLPRDIAVKLAHDVHTLEVASPIIQTSEVFTEQDLLDLIATSCPQRLEAIARKKRLSEVISDALIASGERNTILALTANPGARISENGYNTILNHFSDDNRITENLCLRPALPPAFAERLIHLVSESLKDYILNNHRISPETTARIIQNSREKATVQIIQPGTPASHIERMVRHLHANHRLTDSLIARAICTGDIRFFECALAERAQLPVANIRRVLAAGDRTTHERLYTKCHVGERLFPLLHAALALYGETISDHSEEDAERFGRRVMERLLTFSPRTEPETFERLLEKLNGCSQSSAA
jgi:uncharacterized protein (DUF2336 family)